MKTNVSIEITDFERNALARFLDGKPTKRLAKRAELVEFCRGLVREAICQGDAENREERLSGLLGMRPEPDPSFGRPKDEAELVEAYRRDGESESFIRGALQVYRAVRGRKPAGGRVFP